MNDVNNTPIMENEHVQQFLSIMQDNGKDAEGFIAMLSSVTSMEKQLNKAVDELNAVRKELEGMRDHPL